MEVLSAAIVEGALVVFERLFSLSDCLFFCVLLDSWVLSLVLAVAWLTLN